MAAKAIAQVLREVYIQLVICMTGHILCEWSFGIHATIYIYIQCVGLNGGLYVPAMCAEDVLRRIADRFEYHTKHITAAIARLMHTHEAVNIPFFFLVCRQNMIIIGFNMQVRRTTMMDMPAHNQIKHQATTYRTHVLQYWLRQSWSFVLNVVYKQHGEVKVNAYYTTPACYIYQEEHRNAMRHQINSKMHTWCTRVHSLKCTQIRNWTCSYIHTWWRLPKHDKYDTHLLHDKTEHTPRALMMLIMILMGCRHAIQNRIIAECKCICTLLWRRWRQHNRDQPFAIIHPFPRHMKVIMIDVFAWSCGYRSSPVNQPFTNSNNPRVEYFSDRILFRLAVIAFVYSHVCPVQRSAKKCDSHFRHECYKVSK